MPADDKPKAAAPMRLEDRLDAKKKKKRPNTASMQKELRDLSKPDPSAPPKAPVDLKKMYLRVGLVLGALWLAAAFAATWSKVPLIIVGVLSLVVVGAVVWVLRLTKKSQTLGALLQGADTEEGRKSALERLETDYKKGDAQATLARAQLEMQDDPKKALATLESVNLEKQMQPVADQVRSMRAMIHLSLGDTADARALVDVIDVSKAQDTKTRGMYASVVGEAWGRSGQAKKAIELLEMYNPEDPDFAELRVQMWRARAFAYAGASDMKGARRALLKLAEMNPQLLGMFLTGKKVHPLLQQEAKQLYQRSGGYVQRKMVRQR